MRPALTLVEMIIAITILLIIAGTGVLAYSSVRRSLVIDLQADALVSQLLSMQSEVKNMPRCKGVRFEKNKTPQILESAFNSSLRTCERAEVRDSLSLGSDVIVNRVYADLTEVSAVSVLFEPPHAGVTLTPGISQAEVVLSLKNAVSKQRRVRIHKTTGVIEKIK